MRHMPRARATRRVVRADWLVVGTDAHARNYALLLSGPDVRLAPLYDLNSFLPYSETTDVDLATRDIEIVVDHLVGTDHDDVLVPELRGVSEARGEEREGCRQERERRVARATSGVRTRERANLHRATS